MVNENLHHACSGTKYLDEFIFFIYLSRFIRNVPKAITTVQDFSLYIAVKVL